MYKYTADHRVPGIARLILAFILAPSMAFSHPMGNFSINHYARIQVGQRSIEIRYLIDMAEIPAFQETREFNLGPSSDKVTVSRYLAKEEQLLKEGLSIDRDGKPLHLDAISRKVTFPEGAGGLLTMKISFAFRATTDAVAGAHKLSYVDNNFTGRAGWKEVVVVGDGVAILNSSAPETDRSQELTAYSSDVLNSPPQQVSAVVGFRTSPHAFTPDVSNRGTGISPRHTTPAQPDLAPEVSASNEQSRASSRPNHAKASTGSAAPASNTPRSRFTELISTQNSLSFLVLSWAALIAVGLGALHALEPGHGKTIVAAYLVGSRGTAEHAVLLGVVVTAAHTAGVYLLGAATLYASRYIVPERLYPWLGAISGLSIAVIGSLIFLRHWTGETGEHSHAPGEQHSHWFLSIFKQAAADKGDSAIDLNRTEPTLSMRQLCMLGVTGGIVPCPAALVVLLSAFSLHRIGFGLFLITAFSFGLAAVLVIIGLTMVYARRAISLRLPAASTALCRLPFLSAVFMIVVGVGLAWSSISSVQIWHVFPSADKMVPFATVILLGLFLGMRHSTDPDHVVAVSTIVSRQGTIRSSAVIGLLWGLGHTLTIFLVGSAIIVFGVVIPPRLGLSMEFGVALMLIVLGVLNLTGVLGRIAGCMAPPDAKPAMPSKIVAAITRQIFRDRAVGTLGLYQVLRPLAVGLVHGLAGSAAVALLVLSTIRSPLWSTAYLLVFGFGTMIGMMLMTAAISMPLVYAGKKLRKMNSYLIATSGIVSMAFGLFLVYQIGFVDGLFTANVHWTPQ